MHACTDFAKHLKQLHNKWFILRQCVGLCWMDVVSVRSRSAGSTEHEYLLSKAVSKLRARSPHIWHHSLRLVLSRLMSCCMGFGMSDWSLLYNYCAFFNTHWSGVLTLSYSVIWLLHGWCHVKLLLSRCTFCMHHTNMHRFSVSLHAWPCM